MGDESSEGQKTPWPDAGGDIDAWSLAVFDALQGWPLAAQGEWSRWEPGYLVLRIASVSGEAIDPIIIDTMDDEVTVTFGYWETHLPEPFGTGEASIEDTLRQAKSLVEDWLEGRTRTAVLTDHKGSGAEATLIETAGPQEELRGFVESVRDFGPAHIEMRTPREHEWSTPPIHPSWLKVT